jgi:hypothetical protein
MRHRSSDPTQLYATTCVKHVAAVVCPILVLCFIISDRNEISIDALFLTMLPTPGVERLGILFSCFALRYSP